MDDMENKARTLIAQMLNKDVSRVTDDAGLTSDLGADSLDAVEIVIAMESEFGVEITDDEAESVRTVGDLLRGIRSKLSQA